MHSDSLICLRFEFMRSSWKKMLQQLHSASGNSRFLWKALNQEVGGWGWLHLFKHHLFKQHGKRVEGLPWAASRREE